MKGNIDPDLRAAGDEHLKVSSSSGRSNRSAAIGASGEAAPRFVPRRGTTEPEKPQRRSESATLDGGADYPSGSTKPLQSELLTRSPWILLLVTIAAIFAVEAIEMSVFLLFDAGHSVWTALVDSSILTLVTLPILFFLLFRPLTRALTEHQRVESELRRSVETQMSLHRVTSPAIDLLESEVLLDAVIDEVLPLVRADAAWVTVPGEDKDDLPRVIAQRGVPEEFIAAEVSSPLATCPVCGPLLDGKRAPAGLALLTECPRLPKAAFASAGLRTHVGTLLRTGNGRQAILNIGWREHRTLTKTDRALLATVVHQLGIALENAQLYHAEQRARKTAQTLRRASLAIAGTLDLDTVIRTLLDHLAELIPYDRARVMLLEGSSRLRVHAMSDAVEGVQFIDQRSASFDVADDPVLRKVLSGKRGKIIGDTHRHVAWGGRR